MISDSVPWKESLLSLATTLESRGTQARWTGRTTFLVERDVMLGAYSVRKLIEAHKVSQEVVSSRVSVQRYTATGKPHDVLDRWSLDEFYDMSGGRTVQVGLEKFCNQIIHSWIWMLSATETKPLRFNGIFVSSDHERRQFLYFIPLDSLVSAFRKVGNDEVLFVKYMRNAVGERVVQKASAREGV